MHGVQHQESHNEEGEGFGKVVDFAYTEFEEEAAAVLLRMECHLRGAAWRGGVEEKLFLKT